MTVFASVLVVVALVSAARSMWSPCGLSMLSTLTPFSEAARGHRYGLTAAWFVAGGVAGGLLLGVPAAALAWLGHGLPLPTAQRSALFALAAVVAVAADLGLLRVPSHPRQVDETWIGRYRRWIYAAGFGVQIGCGLATYVMTAGVYLVVVGGALSGSPVLAAVACVVFGFVRGLLVLVSAACRDAGAVRRVHAVLEARAGLSVGVTVVVCGVGSVLTAFVWSPAAGVAVAVLLGAAATASASTRSRAGLGTRVGPATAAGRPPAP